MEDELKQDKDGKLICPNCGKPMNKVTQTFYNQIIWEWNPKIKKYEKFDNDAYDEPVCGECEKFLLVEYRDKLSY